MKRLSGFMINNNILVVFTLDDHSYALPLFQVRRIIRVAGWTPLPQAPEMVLGVINISGEVIPVFNMRKRFGIPDREIHLSDQLIVAQTSKRAVALLVDHVENLIEEEKHQRVEIQEVIPDLKYIEGIVKLDSGLILIHNLESFLSVEEEKALDQSLENVSREDNG